MSVKGIFLECDFLLSSAWLKLPGTAKSVFLIFRLKCQMEKIKRKQGAKGGWMIANNGEIVFTYKEAKQKYDISSSRFDRAIDDLVGFGFIDICESGRGLYHMETKYGISERWRRWGQPDFVQKSRPKGGNFGIGFRHGNCLGAVANRKKVPAKSAH